MDRGSHRIGLAIRLALREMRGGLASLRIFLACLTLGVFALAAISSLEASLVEGLAGQGQEILGGDVELRLVHRAITPNVRAQLQARSEGFSEIRQLRSMAQLGGAQLEGAAAGQAAADSILIELKAVDGSWPLAGEVVLDPPIPLSAVLSPSADGAFGVGVDRSFLESLGLRLGQRFRIGKVELIARAVVVREPDRLADNFSFAPRILASAAALEASGLVRPGSLITYHYRFLLAGEDIGGWVARLGQDFPNAGWRVRDRTDSSPSVRRFIERITLLLTLVSLSALLVGGIGVANAVSSYLDSRLASIAIFKCLGARGADVFRIYLVQIIALALVGITAGLVLGAGVPFLVAGIFAERLPIPLVTEIHWSSLAASGLYGFLIALLFSILPLARARLALPQRLLRAQVQPMRERPPLGYMIAFAVLAAMVGGLALLLSPDRRFAIQFLIGAPLAFGGVFVAAHAVIAGLARLRPPTGAALMLARSSLLRARTASAAMIMGLALSLGLISAIAMVDANLQVQISAQIPDRAPSFFFADIASHDLDAFTDFLSRRPGLDRIETTPMLRGSIVRLKGRDVRKGLAAREVAWVLQGDRGLTYAATPPPGARLVSGGWWAADYRGPPLVSIGAEIARGLGLQLGDTLTVDVLGRPLTATIANLREIDWASLGLNFVLIFSPDPLRNAPHSHLATAALDAPDRDSTRRAVARAFPDIVIIPFSGILEAVNGLLVQIAQAARAASVLSLLTSALVLAGALAAGYRQRLRESVIFKMLGAPRRLILLAGLVEFVGMGLAGGLIGLAVGSVTAWALVAGIMEVPFIFLPGPALITCLLALAVTLGFGLIMLVQVLRAPTSTTLRALS